MSLKANSKILWRLTDILIDRISPQFWSILILESVFLLFTPQNHSLLSAFHLVSAFMGLISKVYFVKFYTCISSVCVRWMFCCTITEAVFSWKSILFQLFFSNEGWQSVIWAGFGLPVSVSGTLADRLLWLWATERHTKQNIELTVIPLRFAHMLCLLLYNN